jgi:hypothetical protein
MRGSIPATVSASLTEARKRSLDTYRSALRLVPFMVITYNLPLTVAQCRQRIQADFRRYSAVDDSLTVDRLVFGARTEIEETSLVYKQRSHVLNYFLEHELPSPPS